MYEGAMGGYAWMGGGHQGFILVLVALDLRMLHCCCMAKTCCVGLPIQTSACSILHSPSLSTIVASSLIITCLRMSKLQVLKDQQTHYQNETLPQEQ